MKMISIILVLSIVLMSYGCMSEKEYMLRKANAVNAAAHPATFPVLTIRGPVNIAAGAELTAQAPTQPFQPLTVPDGIATQAGLAKTAIGAALIGYGVSRIGDSGDTKVINNTGGAE